MDSSEDDSSDGEEKEGEEDKQEKKKKKQGTNKSMKITILLSNINYNVELIY